MDVNGASSSKGDYENLLQEMEFLNDDDLTVPREDKESKEDSDEESGCDESLDKLPYTSSAALSNIVHDDSTVELVAHVDEIENPNIFGEPTKEKKRWRIFVHNNDGKRIQVTIWNKEIDRLQNKIKLGHKIHIDGAYSKFIENKNWNLGNVPFELIIQGTTKVECIEVSDDVRTDPEFFTLEDFANASGYIMTHGFIKTTFMKIEAFKEGLRGYGLGSITDGVYKLEIRLVNIDNLSTFTKGTPVTVKGYVKNSNGKFYLQVIDEKGIKELKEKKMRRSLLLEGNKAIMKRIADNDDSLIVKKIKST